MNSLSIQNHLRSLQGVGQLGNPEVSPNRGMQPIPGPQEAGKVDEAQGPSFQETLSDYINEVNTNLKAADQGAADLASGRSQDVHGTLIQMQKADMQLKVMVEARNKVLRAYEEVMRMQA